jgi:hypothetical protein
MRRVNFLRISNISSTDGKISCLPLNVHEVSDVRRIEIHAAEPIVPKYNNSEVVKLYDMYVCMYVCMYRFDVYHSVTVLPPTPSVCWPHHAVSTAAWPLRSGDSPSSIFPPLIVVIVCCRLLRPSSLWLKKVLRRNNTSSCASNLGYVTGDRGKVLG